MDPMVTSGFLAPSAPPLLCERRNAVRKGGIGGGGGGLVYDATEWEGHVN